MAEYFGGAPNAFQGGVEFGAYQRRRRLHDNALAYLIDRYGPAAADPQSLAALQSVEQSEELHPLQVAEARRVNAAREAAVTEHGVMAGDPAVQQRDMATRLAVAKRASNVLKLAKQNKGDLGRAFDFVQSALPSLGVPAEHVAALREAVVQNPDNVDELVAFLQDPDAQKSLSGGQPFYDNKTGRLVWGIPTETGFRIVEGYTPATAFQAGERVKQGAERLKLGWSNLDFDKLKEFLPARQAGVQSFMMPDGRVVADVVPGSPAEQELSGKLQELDAGDKKFIRAFESLGDHAGVIDVNIRRALELMDDSWIQKNTLLSTQARKYAAKFEGTDSYDIFDSLEAVKNNLGIDELQRMRQSSPTGGAMGNVSDRDISLLTGALGRLQVERDPAKLREDLLYVQRVYSRIKEAAEKDAEGAQFRMQLREQRRGASFGPQPRPTPGGTTTPETGTPDLSQMSDEELLRLFGGGGGR